MVTFAARADGGEQADREQQSVRWPPKDGQPKLNVDREQRIETFTVSG